MICRLGLWSLILVHRFGFLSKWARSRSGRRVTRQEPQVSDKIPAETPSIYWQAMVTALAFREKLVIAQVGANDGLLNDPLHHFARSFPDRTKLLLIEPQETVIPYLKSNYAFHPKATVFQGAVGKPGRLKLFTVDPAYWDQIDASYAKKRGWPAYRAPTGVASQDRAHVRQWLVWHLKDKTKADAAIKEIDLPSLALADIMRQVGWPDDRLDVLQVDVEGADDEVLYHSALEQLWPRIILFESKNLRGERFDRLLAYLEGLGYSFSQWGGNCLAVAGQPRSS